MTTAAILKTVQRIERRVSALTSIVLAGEDAMSVAVDNLTREVQESRGVIDSAVALITGLADQIRDLKDDPAALEALAADLDAQQQTLAGAVAAQNPPAPTPPV